MMPLLKISNSCIACDQCRLICPESAVITDGKIYLIDNFSCTYCTLCVEICPTECIKLESSSSENNDSLSE